MTQEVLGYGDDRPGRDGGPGRAVGVVVAVALLAVFGMAVARSRPDDARRGRPAPSAAPPRTGWTEYPVDDSPGMRAAPEFASYVTVRRPPPGVLRAVLLPGGVPGFLVPAEDPADEPTALSAFGGPAHAQVVVGWCAATSTFQDPDGAYVYDRSGGSLRGGDGLGARQVRRNARDPLRLDVDATPVPAPRPDVTTPPPRCPGRLYLPTLPRRAAGVHDTLRGHRVVRGRYVVTTETRAFCTAAADAGCAAEGWESYGDGLPPEDLAASYTWEGDFVVRGDTGGRLSVARLPGTRLVRRERAGVRAVLVQPVEVTGSGGSLALRVATGSGGRSYALRADCEVFLGRGVTGLGRPRGTGETLRAFLDAAGDTMADELWLVLDARGRVLRVVRER